MIAIILVCTCIVVITYSFITLLLHIGLSKSALRNERLSSVTILIAARNEENLIPFCLESMTRLDYPSDLLEIYILNDGSTDNTKMIAQSYIDKFNYFHLLDVKNDDKLLGKTNALSQGIKNSSGEIILITDADCIVPPDWVKEFIFHFNENIGLVGGMTLLSRGSSQERLFDQIQALDWLFLQGIAAGSAGIGLPVSVLGNNFGFRRTAYEEVGGYDKLGFSLTEDMILLKAIVSTKKWRVIYPLLNENAIFSKPVENLKHFYHQRKRWIIGGKDSPGWGLFLMILSMVTHLFIFLLFFVDGSNLLAIVNLVILFGADFILMYRLLNRFYLKKLLIYFPLYEIYYFSYTLIFAILMIIPTKIRWKDRSY